jgi:hypothetical protein
MCRFTRSYPRNAPIIELEKIEGLSDEQLAELQSLLEKEVRLGTHPNTRTRGAVKCSAVQCSAIS